MRYVWVVDLWQKIVFDNPPVGFADTLPCMSCPVGTRRASLMYVWDYILQRKTDLDNLFKQSLSQLR